MTEREVMGQVVAVLMNAVMRLLDLHLNIVIISDSIMT